MCFPQDSSCFACGMENGFRIFDAYPFRESISRNFEDSGVGIVEMLFRCNVFALVGGGQKPKFLRNRVGFFLFVLFSFQFLVLEIFSPTFSLPFQNLFNVIF